MLLPLLPLVLPALQDAPPEVAALFIEHCAQCHGETGNGDGWAELDRLARSFQDGGFAYGNTPEAIFRTLTNGIPGTPMPAFDTTLSPDQRRELATYVISLGPEVREVERAETILRVGDRPQWVRGHLPPIAEGAGEHVRGLLLGLPEGLTFEYRADDVRLLGVRAGEFVERTDWTGRGGTPLKPLGQVLWLSDHPEHEFVRLHAGAVRLLTARLSLTRGNLLAYDLVEAKDVAGPRVEERLEVVTTGAASGFRRWIRVRSVSRGPDAEYQLLPSSPRAEPIDELWTRRASPTDEPTSARHRWRVYKEETGRHVLKTEPELEALKHRNTDSSTDWTDIHLVVLVPATWNDALRTDFLLEMNR